jgi:hypothetical protein
MEVRHAGCGKGPLPDWDNQPVQYSFALGRGEMVFHDNTRRLEDNVLPILHGTIPDEDMRYDVTTFVTLEQSPLTAESNRGTHFLVAYANGIGARFTDEQQKQVDDLKEGELNRDEETVLFLQATATNTGKVPRYA